MKNFKWTRGSHARDAMPVARESASFDEFCAAILADVQRAKGLGYFAAPFSGGRSNENAQPRNWIALDLDHCTPSQLARLLHAISGCSALVYTTSSHTDESPRVRVVLELSDEVDGSSIRATCAAYRNLLSSVAMFDEKCDDPARIMFLPVVGFRHWRFYGQPLEPVRASVAPIVDVTPPPGEVDPLAKAAAEGELEKALQRIASAPDGERNHVINGAAFQMGRFVGAGRLDEASTIAALINATVTAGWAGPHKTANTIRSAIRKGAKDPAHLVVPPLVVPDRDSGSSEIYSVADLMKRDFKPVEWALKDILPEGVTILSGPPKCGKSWLVYQACVAVATGTSLWNGRDPEKQGDALYLALEDNERRMRRRIDQVTAHLSRGTNLSRLYAVHDWPRADVGAAKLAGWMREHPGCRLVVIDTLAAFREADPGRKSAYQHDYALGESLKPLAKEFNAAIVLVSHTRKLGSADYMQMVSGTQGLTGGVDNVIGLERGRGDNSGVLRIDGRDIEEPVDLSLHLDGGRWSCVGRVEDVERSQQRCDVMAALHAIGGVGSAREVLEAMEKPPKLGALKMRLSRMVKSGEIMKGAAGYSLPTINLPDPTHSAAGHPL